MQDPMLNSKNRVVAVIVRFTVRSNGRGAQPGDGKTCRDGATGAIGISINRRAEAQSLAHPRVPVLDLWPAVQESICKLRRG